MLVRTRVDAEDGSFHTTVISRSLDEGFEFIAGEVESQMGRYASTLFDVLCDASQVPDSCLERLRATVEDGAWVQTSPAGFNPFYQGLPRARVDFHAVTWDGVVRGEPVNEKSVEHEWTIVACPPGEDFTAFEIAQTLMWDADDNGEHLPEREAARLARCLSV